MSAKTFYTAIGRLERRRNGSGSYPIIRLGSREYEMDLQEMAVWTSLAWHIVRREEIAVLYARLLQGGECPSQHPIGRTLDACIDRLVTRGLLIAGQGDTEYDALYDLFASIYIIPACGSLWLRLLTFLKLTLLDGVSFRAAGRLFEKDQRTGGEVQVMRLAGQALLSTAEIIKCREKGIDTLPTEEHLLDALYSDRDTTSDNIAWLAKNSPSAKEVTLDVANLYLRRQIVLERV